MVARFNGAKVLSRTSSVCTRDGGMSI